MTLQEWATNSQWFHKHPPDAGEIAALVGVVRRDLHDAEQDAVSFDCRFGCAYNAGLKLCAILLNAEGYRAKSGTGEHKHTVLALPYILGESWRDKATYLNACGSKRNAADYNFAGGVSEHEVTELIEFVKGFQPEVLAWLKTKHPDLLPPPKQAKG